MPFSKPKQRWQLGDFVRVTSEVTQYGLLDHAGELGVIIDQSFDKQDKTWYHKVWFGPHTGALASVPPEYNWRGYYDEWLEFVPTLSPYRQTEDSR